jgi:phosphopentomutase
MAKRAVIMIIDALGIGSMPDWKDYDEVRESNTLHTTCKYATEKLGGIKLENLRQLGIANIIDLPGLEKTATPVGSYGKMAELNAAKDTITGHWEMVGIKAENAFPYYPHGFSEEILEKFKQATGTKGVLGNCTASGTTIINEFGDEHNATGYPIIYTSADSVMQIACDVARVPLETQYAWCKIAREIMRGQNEVARIIARPFALNPNYRSGSTKAADMKYVRLGDKRHDYSVLPHSRSVLDTVIAHGGRVTGLGKIQDIFAGVGVPENIHTDNNADGLNKFIHALKQAPQADKEIVFINLVETDSNYGHRRDPEGFTRALEAIDQRVPEILASLGDNDILLISADHGCDPCAVGSDHTREYVPIVFYNKNIEGRDLGTRETFADMGATILDWFGLKDSEIKIQGESFLR